ncbi:MAG: ABC transporter ATP-binding protein [Candidatus Hydrogenedentota bacterium]
MKPYLELNKLEKVYPTPKGPAVIVRDFNLLMEEGEFVSVIGHSGCGKSTVLSMVAGLSEISEGGIVLAGEDVTGPGPDRGVVFQAPSLLPWMTALDNVMLGVNQVMPDSRPEIRTARAEKYLRLVGLGASLHKKPAELSQGMRQRVGIARAFALSPRLLLLDEPFGMLDSLTRLELQEVLIELWREEKITALLVTHDVDEALYLSDRIVMMTSGPEARVGEIMDVPFLRPRTREGVLEHAQYDDLRGRLISFLEERAFGERTPPGGASRHRRDASLERPGTLPASGTPKGAIHDTKENSYAHA